jgi:hypothetical protein
MRAVKGIAGEEDEDFDENEEPVVVNRIARAREVAALVNARRTTSWPSESLVAEQPNPAKELIVLPLPERALSVSMRLLSGVGSDFRRRAGGRTLLAVWSPPCWPSLFPAMETNCLRPRYGYV